jgi:hypothetical protein
MLNIVIIVCNIPYTCMHFMDEVLKFTAVFLSLCVFMETLNGHVVKKFKVYAV